MKIFIMLKGVLLIPIIYLLVKFNSSKSKEEIYAIYHLYSKRVLSFMGFKLVGINQDNIPREGSIYFVSNHQGTIDPALIVGTCPRPLAFISKKENETKPIFGKMATSIGTIHFDRNSREGNVYMLREAARRLKSGNNLLIFPEGTRSKGDKMNEFKAGALKPAYLAKATIVPITLNNSYCLDQKHIKNRQLTVVYGKAIPYREYKDIDSEVMSHRLHNLIAMNIIK